MEEAQNIMKKKDSILKYKLLYTSLILLLYILGRCIPLYGIDTSVYVYTSANAGELLMQTISGDAYRSSIFALGIAPYMISTILVQIVMACRNAISKTKISPGKINRISMFVTFIFAIAQAFSRIHELRFTDTGHRLIGAEAMVIMEMVTGVMVIMWLSDRNAKYGIGNRMIFALVNIMDGIVSILGSHTTENLVIPIAVSAVVLMVTMVMENAEKRIPVQRISIHNIYADKNYMAIKLNPVGVMPVMFSTAFFMLPKLCLFILSFIFPNQSTIVRWQEYLSLTDPVGIVVYIVCLYLLTFIFAMIMISPKDITEQFLKSGDSIVDLHAGRDTRRYLRGVMCRISFLSATVMGVCVGVPLFLQLKGNIDNGLTMLPTSVMMLISLWCSVYREAEVIHNYDSYRPLL